MSVGNPIVSYIGKAYSNDFGSVNFLSGIMVSTSVNTLTGYCSSVDGSKFVLASGVFSFLASMFLFLLYQKLSAINKIVCEEIDSYCVTLEINEKAIQKQILWEEKVSQNKNVITIYVVLSILFGVIMLSIMLLLAFLDINNKWIFKEQSIINVERCELCLIIIKRWCPFIQILHAI